MPASVCRNCGGSMMGKRSTAVFCNRKCKEKYNRQTKRTGTPAPVIIPVEPAAPAGGVLGAVVDGSELDQLKQMRLRVAEAIDECRRAADLPALTKRLQELTADIASYEQKPHTWQGRSIEDNGKPRPFQLKAI